MLSLSMLRSHALQSSCSGVRERSINNSLLSKNESELTHKWFYNFTMQLLMCAFVLFCSLFSLTASAAEAGDVLDSPASVHYFYNGLSYSKSDNAPFVVESAADSAPGAPGTSSAIDIWGPVSAPNSEKNSTLIQSECRIGNSTTSTTQLTYANGNPLNLPASIPSQQSDVFKAGSPLIIRVIDLDENLDNNQIDTVTVTINSTNPIESKELVLHETTNDSGEFIGIIQTTATESASANSCDLALTPESQVSINYQDSQDAEDSQSKTLSFDPYSRVFNAYTGELIDGITVRLIDNSNGLPATVYGDDGTSTFPNTIVSGGQAQDSSGKSYNFPTGGYRFPYIENGDYRIEVDTSIAYIFPSETDDQVIQTLPTAPYRLNNASRGFAASSQNLLLNVDIPLDPQSDRILLDKSSTLTTAGIGDFVPFEISMTNIEYDVSNIKLIDTLPVGLSYVEGSLRVNKAAYSDVLVSNNGQQITVNFPSLLSQEIVNISYISQVSATASGTMTNVAEISHPILKSNIATASIDFRDDLMRDKAQVIGRVILDDCDGNLDAEGLAGIRILMEDGRYVVSDQEGQWHFEGIKPGTHVIQLDVATLPPYLELSTCDNEFFHAGQSYSQFIDVQPGTLWRADFHVQPKMPDNGDVKQTLLNELMPLSEEERLAAYKTPVDKKIIYTANIGGTGVALNNVIEEIRLPAGTELKEGSLTLDGAPYPYDYRNNNIFVHIGDKPKEWSHEIKFTAFISTNAKKGTLAARAILHYEIGPLLKDSTPLAETRVNLFIPPSNGNADPLKNPKFESLSNVLTDQDKSNLSDVIFALEGLQDLEIAVTGHTDNIGIAKRNRHIYADNQALSEARAAAVAEYISTQINLPIEKIKIAGLGKTSPRVSNRTSDGRAKNRRVEVRVLNARSDVALVSVNADVQIAKTKTLIPGLDLYEATAAGANTNPEDQIVIKQQPIIDDAWFVNKRAEKDWVWPPSGYSPDISATNILVQHQKNNRIRLTLNGVPVHSIYFDGIKRAKGKAVSVSEWRGIN
ncbi:MAG: putative repeat protein (TIGR01451 family), partial [Oleispira sp.]